MSNHTICDNIHTAAHLLVQRALEFKPRKIHLCVLVNNRRPVIPYHWQRMNMFGVSFARQDAVAAEVWAVDAMRAGYVPAFSSVKNSWFSTPREICDMMGKLS
jgi:hypothetical protein